MITPVLPRIPRDLRDLSATFFPKVARRNPCAGSRMNRLARPTRPFLWLRVCARAHASASMRVHMRGIAEKGREGRGFEDNANENNQLQRATSISKVAARSLRSRMEARS